MFYSFCDLGHFLNFSRHLIDDVKRSPLLAKRILDLSELIKSKFAVTAGTRI